jgi:hypothetical protein
MQVPHAAPGQHEQPRVLGEARCTRGRVRWRIHAHLLKLVQVQRPPEVLLQKGRALPSLDARIRCSAERFGRLRAAIVTAHRAPSWHSSSKHCKHIVCVPARAVLDTGPGTQGTPSCPTAGPPRPRPGSPPAHAWCAAARHISPDQARPAPGPSHSSQRAAVGVPCKGCKGVRGQRHIAYLEPEPRPAMRPPERRWQAAQCGRRL